MNVILPLLFLFGILWWASGSKWLIKMLSETRGSISDELDGSHTVYSAETTRHDEAEFVDDGVEWDTKWTRRFRTLLIVVFMAVFLMLYVAQDA